MCLAQKVIIIVLVVVINVFLVVYTLRITSLLFLLIVVVHSTLFLFSESVSEWPSFYDPHISTFPSLTLSIFFISLYLFVFSLFLNNDGKWTG